VLPFRPELVLGNGRFSVQKNGAKTARVCVLCTVKDHRVRVWCHCQGNCDACPRGDRADALKRNEAHARGWHGGVREGRVDLHHLV
jgi:hypothetical protein